MTRERCHRRRKMMGRSANGGCGTEEKHCPVSTSRVPNKFSPENKDAQLAPIVGIDFYSQACKALAVISPFDLEDGQKKTTSAGAATLPGGLASCLSKHSDSRKRHKKSNLGSDAKKNKSSSRQEKNKGNNIWSETEDYFREVSVDDVERLNEASSFNCNKFISIPNPANNRNETDYHNDVVLAVKEEQDVNQLMEVDGAIANDNETAQNQIQNQQEDNKHDVVCSLPQFSSGVEWLLGSRNKIYLASERPSKKRKLLGSEAGLEKLFVAQPVKDLGPSTCCHYCSLGDTGNQLNRLIICNSCGVAVHQRCYGVQQDNEAGGWLCSWCKLVKDEDKSTDRNSHCLLCPQQGGALKPVRKKGGGNDGNALVEFAHLFCCQWMPEVYIEDMKNMEPILNIEGIKDAQKKLICYICKVKCGACVRCSYGSCRTSFHPVCAREAKHRMEIWGKFGCDHVELRAFCLKHSEAQKELNQQAENLPLSSFVNVPNKIQKTGEKLSPNAEATNQLDIKSNLKSQTQCVNGEEVKASITVEDVKMSDSSNFTLLLKKLVERGKVNLKDVASEINVSANLLESSLADGCLAPDLHGKIVKWLKSHAHVGGMQKNIKLKVISKGEKESAVENANKASDNNSSAVKASRRTKGNIRVLKDNNLLLSLKTSSEDDGVSMDEDKNGGIVLQESSPDFKDKILVESFPDSDLLMSKTSDHKGVAVKCINLNQQDCDQVDNPNRAEAKSYGSYVHPLIQNQVLSEVKSEEEVENDACSHQNPNSVTTESTHEFITDLGRTKRLNIINMSPVDEVEGELVYYQHQLLCNAVAKKHLSDVLISKVMKHLPQEIETLRSQNWDAVLVNRYLSDLREVKKQGRKERRHKEAQAVLAAATAAAAASSRLSSFRKDDSAPQQENTLKVKVPRAKETHPKLSVTWTSSSNIDNKVQSRVCDVCRRAETILNPIIVCSSCKVAVHIDCYRSVKDSTGPWFCELCENLMSSRNRGIPAECSLCGGTTGAFRKSTGGQWIHAFCAEWVLESTFRRGQVKPIEGMETISKGNEFCAVCRRTVGVCIKCNYGHCQSTFHPTCGKSAGFFMNVRISSGKMQHKAYCEKHSQVERTKAETQKHGVEEWNSMKKVRVELERLRLICERIIKREKLKRELVLCSHDMLRHHRESVPSCSGAFGSPDVSSESATTSLRGGYTNSCSQRSDDDSTTTLAGKRRIIRFPITTTTTMAMDNDQKTDDSSTSQILTQMPAAVRPIVAGKQIPIRPNSSALSPSMSDKNFRQYKHIWERGGDDVRCEK